MRVVDSIVRMAVPTVATAVNWLREELSLRGVKVLLTDASLRELAADAVESAKGRASASHGMGFGWTELLSVHAAATTTPVATLVREEVAARAAFLHAWTLSDEKLDRDEPGRRLVALARKYALPRPWKLSVPVAANARHPTPLYMNWASAS